MAVRVRWREEEVVRSSLETRWGVVFVVVTETVAGTDWITSGPPPNAARRGARRRPPPLAAGLSRRRWCASFARSAAWGRAAWLKWCLTRGWRGRWGGSMWACSPLPRAALIGGRGSADGCTATPSAHEEVNMRSKCGNLCGRLGAATTPRLTAARCRRTLGASHRAPERPSQRRGGTPAE